MNKLFHGLPSLSGVVIGIWLYTDNSNFGLMALLIVFLFLLVLLLVGKGLMKVRPLTGLFLIEMWGFSSIIIVALSTALIVWLSIVCPTWLNLPKEQIDTITGVFIGAITTYLASVWIDDIAKGSGIFWPTMHFKDAVSNLGITGDTKYSDAVYKPRVRDNGPIGWGLRARWARTKLVREYFHSITERAVSNL